MLIRQLFNKNMAFACYHLPGEKEPVFVVQKPGEVYRFPLEDTERQKGFIVSRFDAFKTGKAFLIKADFFAQNKQEKELLSARIAGFTDRQTSLPSNDNPIIRKQDYLQQAGGIIAKIRNEEVRKVVLSRVVAKTLPPDFDFDLFFKMLWQSYPHTFVYIFYLPGNGIWAGATPETLLRYDNGFFETMALAGTQKRTSDGQPVFWEKKEKDEQAFVTEFVEAQIKKTGVKSYDKRPVETVFAGELAHICTRFRIPAEALTGKTGHFIRALHPTPAVCGLPKEKAWQLIAETEKHERRFYTGFLGPWKLKDTSHLFVNLRCACFSKEKMNLYVGGGLTADSLPEREWQETEDKSATLLSVVEKMRNFAP